jgi:hypothetical protein
MIIRTEEFELEVSHGKDVYFGSKTSGQVFKRWEDIGVDEKFRIESIVIIAEQLIREYEAEFFSESLINNKLSPLGS